MVWKNFTSAKNTGGLRQVHKADKILAIARSNYVAGASSDDSIPPLGIRWGQLRDELRNTISNFESSAEAIKFAQLRGIFDHRQLLTAGDIPRIEIAQHFLKYEYPEFMKKIYLFRETPATTPGTSIEYQSQYEGNILVSDILYFHAFYILTTIRYKGDIDSICEIGGGYGNPAFQWFTNPVKRVRRYCIVDIPEVLFFAEVFLRTALPKVKFHYATESAPVSASSGVTLVPIQLSSQTRNVPFDIVTNTGSMGEMTDDWVQYWCNWLDKQNTKLFYSHNYIGNPVGAAHDALATLAPIVPQNWQPVYVRPMHPMMFLQSTDRIASEIIFKRVANDDSLDVTKALEIFKGTKLRLENYVYILYALLRNIDSNRNYIMEFARKVINDFGYAPVELLYLLKKGDQNNKDLIALRDDLQRRVDSKFSELSPEQKSWMLGQSLNQNART
jgi:putative sugar O-methyltransferase